MFSVIENRPRSPRKAKGPHKLEVSFADGVDGAIAMPVHTVVGSFYEFHRDQPNREIGAWISRVAALFRVRAGGDVYTPARSDAASLAKDVYPGKADWEGSHLPRVHDWDFTLPENRRFPHYHPGGSHELGHIFYGERGYRVGESRP